MTETHFATDLDGSWIALKKSSIIAPITEALNPKTQILFERVTSDGYRFFKKSREWAIKTVPLGESLQIDLGGILDCNILRPNPHIQTRHNLPVFFDEKKRFVSREYLSEQQLLPPCAYQNEIPKEFDRTIYEIFNAGDAYHCAIMNTQVPFKMYAAPTSLMAIKVLRGDPLDAENAFFYRKHTNFCSESKSATLWLRPGNLKADAALIARNEFEATKDTFKSLSLISSRFMIDRSQSGCKEVPLYSSVPFTGRSLWSVRAVEYLSPSHKKPILIILEILSCSRPPPWNVLSVAMDQRAVDPEKKSKGEKNEDNSSGSGSARLEVPKFFNLSPHDQQPKPDIARVIERYDFAAKFPAYAGTIEYIPRDPESTRGSRKSRQRRSKPETLSSQTSNSNGDEKAQPVIFTGRTCPDNEIDKALKSPAGVLARYLGILRCCSESYDVDIEVFTSIKSQKAVFDDWTFQLATGMSPGRSALWCFIDGNQERPFLITKLSRGKRFALAIEIVRDVGEEFATIVAYSSDWRPINEQAMAKFVAFFDEKQGRASASQLEAYSGLIVRKIKHSHHSKAILSAKRLLIASGLLDESNS